MTTNRKENEGPTTHNRYKHWTSACTPDARLTDRTDECMDNLASTTGTDTHTLKNMGIIKKDGRNNRNQES